MKISSDECAVTIRFEDFARRFKRGFRRGPLWDIFADVLFNLSYSIHDLVVEVFERSFDSFEEGKEGFELLVCFYMTMEFFLEAFGL